MPRLIARLRPLFLVIGFLVALTLQTVPPRWGALAVATVFDARAVSVALTNDAARLPTAARALTRDARVWRAETAQFVAYAPYLARLPYIGGDAQSLPQLANALDKTIDALEPTWRIYESLLPQLKTRAAGAALATFARRNATAMSAARAATRDARGAFDALDPRAVSPAMYAFIENARRGVREWDAALRLLERAPVLLGADTPKKYLLLAQNNDELRPTGGFITAVGILQVAQGAIRIEWFGDSLAADDLNLIHPPPPAPLEKYMWASQWLLRDANWYANFPTSAAVAQSMVARDRATRTDGVIAVDLNLLPPLAQAMGAVELDGARLTRANVIDEIKAHWKPLPQSDYMTAEWFTADRKNFLGALLRALLARVTDGEVNAVALAQAARQGLRGKAAQIYFTDADAQQAILDAGWGGAIETGDADYLNVIDANVGFNKVNARVTREIYYQARLNETGGVATVEIIYHNPSRAENDACDLLRQNKDATYASMEQGCYWNYARVLAPRFAQFISAQGVSDAGYADDIDAVTAFGGYVVAPRNAATRVQFQYTLPDTITRAKTYALKLQTQAGAAATPVRVRVEYPATWRIRNATENFQRLDDHTVEFQEILTRDKWLAIYFEP